MVVDLAEIDPYHLRELADLLIEQNRHEAEQRTARLAGLYEAPSLGGFAKRSERGFPEPPPGYRWTLTGLLEATQ